MLNPTIGLESVNLAQPRFQRCKGSRVNRVLTHDSECSNQCTLGKSLAHACAAVWSLRIGGKSARVLCLPQIQTV